MQITKSVAAAAAAFMMFIPLQQASAAKIRDLRFTDGRQFIQPQKQALDQLGSQATRTELHTRMLRLDRGIAISKKSSEVWHGTRTYRYEQTFHGIPIYQYPITIIERESGEVLDVSGTVVDDLGQDIPTLIPKITPEAALKLAQEEWSMQLQPLATFANEHVEEVVYLDQQHAGHLAYRVLFQVWERNSQTPSVPNILVDAYTGRILEKVDTLVHANARNRRNRNRDGVR